LPARSSDSGNCRSHARARHSQRAISGLARANPWAPGPRPPARAHDAECACPRGNADGASDHPRPGPPPLSPRPGAPLLTLSLSPPPLLLRLGERCNWRGKMAEACQAGGRARETARQVRQSLQGRGKSCTGAGLTTMVPADPACARLPRWRVRKNRVSKSTKKNLKHSRNRGGAGAEGVRPSLGVRGQAWSIWMCTAFPRGMRRCVCCICAF
jgi:hypothetical protein